MVVKTFRGLLADGGQDQLRLQTIKGKVGYRIVKFEVITHDPNSVAAEAIVKIYKTQQSSITDTINFTDTDLLAVSYFSNSDNPAYVANLSTIFDNEIFNQDIYVTSYSSLNAEPANYYIELEVIPLTDHAAEYATLKDIRTQRTIT